MRDIIRDADGEVVLPVVYRENTVDQPERVVKHSWGVVMMDSGEKTSVPWHRIKSIREAYDS
jgi:hypothetical protein